MTDTQPATKRRQLSDHEHFQAMSLLDQHTKVIDPAAKTVAYEAGWSDQRIADVVNCTLHNIVGLRDRAFGKLDREAKVLLADPRLDELIAKYNAFVKAVAIAGDISEVDLTPFLVGEPS